MGPGQGAPQQMGGVPNAQAVLALPNIDINAFQAIQNPDERKTFVGNNIYHTIHEKFGEKFAPIITGTLLDEKVVDFNAILTDNRYFNQRVNEAYTLVSQ